MRRRRPEKREILPDPVYGDLIVAKFINNLMKQGKKSLAEKIFYKSIKKAKKQGKINDGIELFKKALENVAPILEVKSKRIGGATYQVPIEISESRRMALAMRWIISFSTARKGGYGNWAKTFSKNHLCLFYELDGVNEIMGKCGYDFKNSRGFV